MAYSTQSVVSDGSLTTLPLSIDYLARSDIKVFIGPDQAAPSAWSWVGTTDKTIKFTPAVQNGVKVTIKRVTNVAGLYHTYNGGAQFTSTSLDESLLQTLMVAQEFSEVASIASDDLPLPVGPQASSGASNKYARADHVHVGGAGGGTVGSVVIDALLGDGTRTAFNLANTPPNEETTQVYVDSVYQEKDTYTLVGSTLTFSEAVPNGASIEVVTVNLGGGKAVDINFVNPPELPVADVGNNLQSLINWLGVRMDTVKKLGTSAGAALVGVVQAGAGAVTRTVEAKLRDRFSVKDFGAVGDGITDDTTAIQAAVNALPKGATLTGEGGTFVVTSLLLKSNMELRSIHLITKAGLLDFTSPITIDGRTSAKSNIRLIDVSVDGNRINQTSITATTEDGGRHGFRLIGAMSNILLLRCTANYCAGDGIEIFSGSSATADDANYVFKGIRLRDCTFNYNRRHGMSGDSIRRLHMDNVELNYNGLDLNTVDPQTSGGRGARQGGNLYGNGIDFEGYGLGSSLNDLRLERVTGLYNARGGCLFYDALETRGVGFVARSKIWISDCYFDAGQDASRTGEALTFTSTIASKALSALYDSVYVQGTRLDGHLLLRNVNNVRVHGEARPTGSHYAVLDYAKSVILDMVSVGAQAMYADNSTYTTRPAVVATPANPALVYSAGVTGTVTNAAYSLAESRGNTFVFLITADWNPTATGVGVLALNAPAGTTVKVPAVVSVTNNNDGAPVDANHNVVSGAVRIASVAAVPYKVQISVTITV